MVASLAIAFIWAFSESVFFFIVPDVWLTWLVISKSASKKLFLAVVSAILGAVLGGVVVYQAGKSFDSYVIKGWLDKVPGISLQLIENISIQVDGQGVYSYLKGMWGGNPYKIYAFLWGTKAGNLWQWLMISVVARATRYFCDWTCSFD